MSTICYGILVARNCIILFTFFCFVLVVLLLQFTCIIILLKPCIMDKGCYVLAGLLMLYYLSIN